MQAAEDSVAYVREEALRAARHLDPDTALKRLSVSLSTETDPVVLFGPRRQHDHGHFLEALIAPHPAQQFAPARIRQHPIEQDDVRGLFIHSRIGFAGAARFQDVVTAKSEVVCDHLAQSGFVLNH